MLVSKKNIALALWVFLYFLPFGSLAQETRIYEEKGTALLKAASEKLKSFNTIKIDFSYKMENAPQGIQEQMDGILYTQGDKFRMKMGDNQFISDGITVWIYLEEIDEVQVNSVENSDMNITPTALLNEFDKQYKSTFIKQEQHQGRLVDIVDLVPLTSQAFFKYRLALDARTNMMVYAAAYDRQGSTYTYNLKNIETNVSIPATTFRFSAAEFPGVDVIDLR